MQNDKPNQHAIILFDGVCNLCQASVRFIIPRDPSGYFRFASIQSDQAEELLRGHAIDPNTLQSLVLIENGRVFTESSAALRISRKLSGGWFLLYLFIIVPRPIRNAVYRYIAKRRYRWFGHSDACLLPTPENNMRFLEKLATKDE